MDKRRPAASRPRKRKFHGNQFRKVKRSNSSVLNDENNTSALNVENNSSVLNDENNSEFDSSSSVNMQLPKSASGKKISMSKHTTPSDDECDSSDFDKLYSGYMIIDRELLFSFLEENIFCKKCQGNVSVTSQRVRGLYTKISATCKDCTTQLKLNNCKLIGEKKIYPN